jgi:hypothetical protein
MANPGRRSVRDLFDTLLSTMGVRFRSSPAFHRIVFTRIYRNNEWGDPESRSGPGSTRARGAAIRDALGNLFQRFSIGTLLDAPCGDFNWMRDATSFLQSYAGVDIVRELIDRNVALYADDKHRFVCGNIVCDPLPAADAILCRDALVHLSYSDIRRTIANFKRTGARYLLATSFVNLPQNTDCRTGSWRPLNLAIAPFHFPAPLAMIDDVPLTGAAWPDKRLCLWSLAELPFA